MDSKSLVWIPLLLLATSCLDSAIKSPNPPVSVKDGAVDASLNEKGLRSLLSVTPVIRQVFWSATLAEAAVVVAGAFPSMSISKKVLPMLLFPGHSGGDTGLTGFRVMACVLILIGSFVRKRCYCALGKHFTLELSIQKDHELITTGPYSIVRHPSYTAAILNNMAVIGLYGARGSWVRESGLVGTSAGRIVVSVMFILLLMGGTVVVLGRIRDEERMLRKQFGTQWDEWAAKVPYLLVPGIV